jgi:hypothetical protein
VPEEALTDLRRRLAAAQRPDKETVADAFQGNKIPIYENDKTVRKDQGA